MPINKVVATKRGKAAVAAIVAAAMAVGGLLMPNGQPAAVALAVEHLIKPWEGIHTTAYKDMVGVWTICWGETKGVKPGMKKMRAECDAMLTKRVTADYYTPLTKCVAGFTKAPISVQASLTSGAYNFGVGAACKSTAARLVAAKRYREACEAQTAFNKAGGRVVRGLVNRREMGDKQRLGEAELCVSGL